MEGPYKKNYVQGFKNGGKQKANSCLAEGFFLWILIFIVFLAYFRDIWISVSSFSREKLQTVVRIAKSWTSCECVISKFEYLGFRRAEMFQEKSNLYTCVTCKFLDFCWYNILRP